MLPKLIQKSMPPVISFFVPGIPAPGGSKSGFPIKKGGQYTGRVAIVEAGGQKTKNWRASVVQIAFEEMKRKNHHPLDGALRIFVDFYLPRPKYHFNKSGLRRDAPEFHVIAPDATKLMRSTEDAMTGIVYRNDSQLSAQGITKRYGETPGAMITVEAL